MRRATLAALGLVLLLAPAAAAQPPIVRPGNEGGKPSVELGRELFAGNCSVCHGSRGEGVAPGAVRGGTPREGAGPPLIGVGRRAADFYLRTGYMPLGRPDEQPERQRVQFDQRELRSLEDYVDSLGGGPPVPAPQPAEGTLSEGFEQFTEHCAGCHQAVAEGGIVTGARVPPLDRATDVQIAEAVRIGPYVMPQFSERQISDRQLNSIIAYVRYANHPDDRGGLGIGHLGPFPEGMVTWLVAAVLLVGFCVLIGERLRQR